MLSQCTFFWDHVFATFSKGSTKKYYDPSYGIKGGTYYSDSKILLNAYASAALTGVLFAKRDISGEPFLDVRHSDMYLDIQNASGGKVPFLYKSKTVDMNKYLAFKLYKTTEKQFYFSDSAITIEL